MNENYELQFIDNDFIISEEICKENEYDDDEIKSYKLLIEDMKKCGFKTSMNIAASFWYVYNDHMCASFIEYYKGAFQDYVYYLEYININSPYKIKKINNESESNLLKIVYNISNNFVFHIYLINKEEENKYQKLINQIDKKLIYKTDSFGNIEERIDCYIRDDNYKNKIISINKILNSYKKGLN